MTDRTRNILFYGLMSIVLIWGIWYRFFMGNAEVTGLLEVPGGCNAAGACWDTAYEVHTTLGTVETDYDTFRGLDMHDRVTVENGELK